MASKADADMRAELHRAKNVLGSISLNSAVLLDDTATSERRDKAKERLRRAVDEMAKLLDKVGDWVRTRSPQQ